MMKGVKYILLIKVHLNLPEKSAIVLVEINTRANSPCSIYNECKPL